MCLVCLDCAVVVVMTGGDSGGLDQNRSKLLGTKLQQQQLPYARRTAQLYKYMHR